MTRAEIFGWTACALSLAWFGVHTFVGGPEVADPLIASDLPMAVRAPAWMVWNMVTGLLLLLAGMFGWATWRGRGDAMLCAALMSGVLAVAGIVSAPLSGAGFAVLPQGILFVPGAVLGWLAWRRFPAVAR